MECISCHTEISLDEEINFCPFCGTSLTTEISTAPEDTVSLCESEEENEPLVERAPPSHIQFEIDQYQVIENIGQGGMGEVLLAYDPTCQREIALKRVRPDLTKKKSLKDRFLKEAHLTSLLTHPAIIPIYNIHTGEKGDTYYTMPFVEGKTLKEILRETHRAEKIGRAPDPIGAIPALMRIFLKICQAVAYAHSKHILHRDLKPENIIVGKYGEAMILDWGLAQLIHHQEKPMLPGPIDEKTSSHTNVGKLVGTTSYMAPERAFGKPASIETEIYALGVILYQILTLRYPFRRKSMRHFRRVVRKEVFREPAEVAPYRDVPQILTAITKKCLEFRPRRRYHSVDALIKDVENYLEGRADWFQRATIHAGIKNDWEFQANFLLSENVAIMSGMEASDWVHLMVSKESFGQNVRITTRIKINEDGTGLGFLLNVPEKEERQSPHDGYCLWIGSDNNRSTKLLRSTVAAMQQPDIYLKRETWYDVTIEKIDDNIHLYLDDELKLSYISHLPLTGTHIGLLSRDLNYDIDPIKVFLGGQNVSVSCLAVPDAFLSHKDYLTALSEYRRIGYTFKGRAEGREAKFRAGVTLLEQARNSTDHAESETLLKEALEEFEKLHDTPGAPLGYLGKGLVYRTQHDYEEEVKCYELACRRYPHHPLLPILHEQVLYRTYESSRQHTKAAYHFILLTLRHLPDVTTAMHLERLSNSLESHWEHLPFILPHESPTQLSIKLTFWLARTHIFTEIIAENKDPIIQENALFSLIELGAIEIAKTQYQNIESPWFDLLLSIEEKPLEESFAKALEIEPLSANNERFFLYLLDRAQATNQTQLTHQFNSLEGSEDFQKRKDCYIIWAHLIDNNLDEASELLQTYSLEKLTEETSLLHFLYGCWLASTEKLEIAQIHFQSILDVASPHSWMLCAHYLKGNIGENSGWYTRAFMWEKRQLYRQLALYYHCIHKDEESKCAMAKESKQYLI